MLLFKSSAAVSTGSVSDMRLLIAGKQGLWNVMCFVPIKDNMLFHSGATEIELTAIPAEFQYHIVDQVLELVNAGGSAVRCMLQMLFQPGLPACQSTCNIAC